MLISCKSQITSLFIRHVPWSVLVGLLYVCCFESCESQSVSPAKQIAWMPRVSAISHWWCLTARQSATRLAIMQRSMFVHLLMPFAGWYCQGSVIIEHSGKVWIADCVSRDQLGVINLRLKPASIESPRFQERRRSAPCASRFKHLAMVSLHADIIWNLMWGHQR